MFRKTLFALFALVVMAANANAALIYDFVIDPATTAGGGSTSTQFGANRWHLYAYDDTAGSLGIAAYNLVVQNATTLLHRSPAAVYTDVDENERDAGFRFLRSANGVFTMVAAQDPNDPRITGYGREASNFPAEIPPGSTGLTITASNAWGANQTRPSIDNTLPWLLMAEGQYAGTPPTVLGPGSNVNLYTASGEPPQMAAVLCNVEGGETCGLGGVQTLPPVLQDYTHGEPSGPPAEYVAAGDQLALNLVTLMQTGGDPATTWALSNFQYIAAYDGVNTNNDQTDAGVTNSGNFTWDTDNANRGIYRWDVTATNAGGADTEQLEIHIQFVPEPATLALVGLALVGFVGIGRRR